jgi:hypothetical protein
LPLPPAKCGPPFPHRGRELSGRAAGSVEKLRLKLLKIPLQQPVGQSAFIRRG